MLDPLSASVLALPRGAGGLAMACPHALPRALPVEAWTAVVAEALQIHISTFCHHHKTVPVLIFLRVVVLSSYLPILPGV